MKAYLGLFLAFASAGCFSALNLRQTSQLRAVGAPDGANSLRFSAEEIVPGSRLRRVERDASVYELITLVRQVGEPSDELDANYCASFGIEKAAMLHFGVAGVVRTIEAGHGSSGELEVTLRNGDVVRVAPWQRDIVRASTSLGSSRYAPSDERIDPLKEWFYFYFTVAAARLSESMGNSSEIVCDGPPRDLHRLHFRAATSALMNGFAVGHAPALFGLVADMGAPNSVNRNPLRRPVAGIGWTWKHVMFAANVTLPGDAMIVVDRWGEPRRGSGLSVEFMTLRAPDGSADEQSRSRLHPGYDWDPDEAFACGGS